MDRDALIASPDLHRAQPLSHLDDATGPLPVDPVARSLPADEAVPEIGRQGGPSRQLPQVGTLLAQHLPRHPVGGPVNPPVGHRVAPLQSLAVEVGIIGEADARPHVAPDVLHPALHLSLGLGPVGTAQTKLEAHPEGKVQHPFVPHRPLLLVPAQGDHLGVVVEAAPRHSAQVLECVDVALDEGGGIRPPDQLHVAGPGPAQGHYEHPDAVPLPVLADVGQAAPVHLGLLPWRCLEAHRGIRLPASPPGRHVALQDRVAALIAQGRQLPVQHHAVLQPLVEATVDVPGVGVQLGCSLRSRLGPDGLRRFQIPAHRVPGDAQFPGDPTDGTARSFHLVDLFHFSHLQQFV